MRGTRAQISLFLIIGIALLAVTAGLFLVLRSPVGDEDFTSQEVPTELLPVQLLVEQCLQQSSISGLKKIGLTGGYIEPARFGMRTIPNDPTSSDAFRYLDGVDIAYWYHLSSPNPCTECELGSHRPELEGHQPDTIEQQLRRYILQNTAACIDDFSSLQQHGFTITELGSMDVAINFAHNDVVFTLNYPVGVQIGEIDASMERYVRVVDVPFRQMYEYASMITVASIEYSFLERHTMELVEIYSGQDRDRLPPTHDMAFSFSSSLFWTEHVVREKIEQLLAAYVPALQVFGAENFEPVVYTGGASAPAIQRLFDNMILPMERSAPFSINFEYPFTPIYFSTNDQGVIRPSSVGIDWIPIFGIQRFNTLYDISYPVRVSMRDDRALSGQGYTFAFGLEANVRKNEPLQPGVQVSQALLSTEPAQFCDPQHFTSADVTLSVTDGQTGLPAQDVQILYDCGISSCAVGSTDSNGAFVGSFPICFGGNIILLGEDVEPYTLELAPNLDEELYAEVTLRPYHELEVVLDVHRLRKSGSTWERVNVDDLRYQEWGIITFNKVDGEYSTVVEVRGDALAHESGPEIRLIPGVYSVMGQFMFEDKQNPLVFPRDRRRTGGLFSKTYYVPEEDEYFDTLLLGGIDLSAQTHFAVIDDGALYAGSQIVIPVVIYDIPAIPEVIRKIEDISATSGMIQYIKDNNLQVNIG